jgi:Mrp family chromosome partitioning ATPase
VEHLLPPHRTLVVVSPARREGRTSVVANLAHELARSGAKVAVADLDGDKPDLARALAPDSLPVLRPDPTARVPTPTPPPPSSCGRRRRCTTTW